MSDLITQRRTAMKLTQAQAAAQAKISLNTWQRIEAGSPARPATLARIAAVLKISATDLAPKHEDSAETARSLLRQAERAASDERLNKLYPTPADPDDDDDYPTVSALAAHYLIVQADTLGAAEMGRAWLDTLPLWVRMLVHANEPWMEAMDKEFKALADSLEAGRGYLPLVNHARIVVLYLTSTWASEVGKDFYRDFDSDRSLNGRIEDLDTFAEMVFDEIAPDDELLMALTSGDGPLAPRYGDLHGPMAHLHPFAWFEPLFPVDDDEAE